MYVYLRDRYNNNVHVGVYKINVVVARAVGETVVNIKRARTTVYTPAPCALSALVQARVSQFLYSQ